LSILITGGSGSFGRAFTSYALEKGAQRVCIYSRGEHAQAEMRAQYPSERLRWLIGDVRDRDRLRRAMEGVELVIHAAALKRIEVGAYNPIEMVKTNVMGAVNVIEAAQDAHVRKVVALSSDKAYQPVSAYGHSKALAESLFLAAESRWTDFAVTRYGNVAGSAGSVIPKWREILKTGDTVPVTDPDCTRFWMTMDEAIRLVSKTAQTMERLAIPELPAYRLGDLAEAMGAKMEITGLNGFEKKHEGMRDGLTSDSVRRMSVQELREGLNAL
jgi:UDP-N-acetylglucosamine 4,6-dehydratase